MNTAPSWPVHLRSSLTAFEPSENPGISVEEYERSLTFLFSGRMKFRRSSRTSLFLWSPNTALNPASERMSTYLWTDILPVNESIIAKNFSAKVGHEWSRVNPQGAGFSESSQKFFSFLMFSLFLMCVSGMSFILCCAVKI